MGSHGCLNEDVGNGVVHISPRKISHPLFITSRRLSLPTMNALGLTSEETVSVLYVTHWPILWHVLIIVSSSQLRATNYIFLASLSEWTEITKHFFILNRKHSSSCLRRFYLFLSRNEVYMEPKVHCGHCALHFYPIWDYTQYVHSSIWRVLFVYR